MIKRNTSPLLTIIVLCCMIWAAACTQQRQPCLTPKIASLNMECIHKLTDTGTVFIDTALPAALLVAFTDSGAQRFIYRTQSANFTLSLSSVTDSCKWGITTDTTDIQLKNLDTLTFVYQRKLQFISNACGYAYFYDLTSVRTTHLRIDSVLIKNTNVTNNVNTKQLQLYIHPDY